MKFKILSECHWAGCFDMDWGQLSLGKIFMAIGLLSLLHSLSESRMVLQPLPSVLAKMTYGSINHQNLIIFSGQNLEEDRSNKLYKFDINLSICFRAWGRISSSAHVKASASAWRNELQNMAQNLSNYSPLSMLFQIY